MLSVEPELRGVSLMEDRIRGCAVLSERAIFDREGEKPR